MKGKPKPRRRKPGPIAAVRKRGPIAAVRKAGLMAALWSSFNGNGDVTTAKTGGRGSGWSYGYTTALGIALDLSALDAPLAR